MFKLNIHLANNARTFPLSLRGQVNYAAKDPTLDHLIWDYSYNRSLQSRSSPILESEPD